MPIEAIVSQEMPVPFFRCPRCGQHFEPFMRGMVVRSAWALSWRWPFFRRRADIWALICWACKDIVGYEAIDGAQRPRDD